MNSNQNSLPVGIAYGQVCHKTTDGRSRLRRGMHLVRKYAVLGARVFYRAMPRALFLCLGLASAVSTQAAASIEDISMVPRLLIQGDPGLIYTIEYADAVQTNTWRSLTNVVVSSNPLVFVDLSAVGTGKRFYRLASQTANPPDNPNPARLAWIPPGTFTLGTPATEQGRAANEGPQTVVTFTQGFYLGRYEVTQGEYEALMGNNPSNFQGDPDLPVEMVSWIAATNYCGTLTQTEAAAGRLPAGWKYSLPTEAQWEYACRAGTTTRFYYGDDDAFYSQLGNYAWYLANSGGMTFPVGQLQPNAWGLYDMAGNVWEWCWDYYGVYPGGSVTDPQGTSSSSLRAYRGGGWDSDGQYCRSASRRDRDPASAVRHIGFRVALVPGPWDG